MRASMNACRVTCGSRGAGRRLTCTSWKRSSRSPPIPRRPSSTSSRPGSSTTRSTSRTTKSRSTSSPSSTDSWRLAAPAKKGVVDPNSCFERAHFEIVYGADVSSLVTVNPANSIVNRLTKFLQYLDVNYPTEAWGQFLSDGNPSWAQIAFGGLSQGAGNSAMIAKSHVVARVVMFSGVTDALPMGPSACQGAANWLSRHTTPTDRYWGLVHDRDPAYPHICADRDSLGMYVFRS